ncbi:MAG TPA: transglutaminaseTgpA domain-containing protein, partial [Gammaproteobacteria bacterium]|nr:transglutaminaseTgpA domain-containing protein [Gammaproteobacteria bacterium]
MKFRHPLIYVSLWCMLMAAATARGAVAEGILGFVSSLVLWGIFYTVGLASGFANAGKENPGNTKVTNAVAVAGIAVFLLMLLSQGLLPALLTFVLWIQGAQNFTLSRPRDLFFALAISFVTILFAASESKSGLFLLCMGLYTLSAVCTLTALYFEQQSQEAHAIAQVEGKLRLPSGMGLLTAVILTASLLLYLCMPQPPATHVGGFFAGGGPYYGRSDWQTDAGKGFQKDKDRGKATGAAADQGSHEPDAGGQTTEAPGGYQGFSQDLPLDSTSAGTKLDPNALLMYVRADRPLYLRGRTFDTFQDDHWVNSEPQTEKLDVETHHVDLRPKPGVATSVETVEVVAPVTDLIFAASRADELEFPGTVIARDRDGALYAPRVLEKGTLYSVSYDQQLADGHPLGEPASLASDDTYLQLPADLDPRIAALAKQVVGTRTDLAAAEAIESYLRSHYQYTLDTIGQPGYTPLSKFLFETKRGHC